MKRAHVQCQRKRLITLESKGQTITLNADDAQSIGIVPEIIEDSKLPTPQTEAGKKLKTTGHLNFSTEFRCLRDHEVAALPHLFARNYAESKEEYREALYNFAINFLPTQITREKYFMLAFATILIHQRSLTELETSNSELHANARRVFEFVWYDSGCYHHPKDEQIPELPKLSNDEVVRESLFGTFKYIQLQENGLRRKVKYFTTKTCVK